MKFFKQILKYNIEFIIIFVLMCFISIMIGNKNNMGFLLLISFLSTSSIISLIAFIKTPPISKKDIYKPNDKNMSGLEYVRLNLLNRGWEYTTTLYTWSKVINERTFYAILNNNKLTVTSYVYYDTTTHYFDTVGFDGTTSWKISENKTGEILISHESEIFVNNINSDYIFQHIFGKDSRDRNLLKSNIQLDNGLFDIYINRMITTHIPTIENHIIKNTSPVISDEDIRDHMQSIIDLGDFTYELLNERNKKYTINLKKDCKSFRISSGVLIELSNLIEKMNKINIETKIKIEEDIKVILYVT